MRTSMKLVVLVLECFAIAVLMIRRAMMTSGTPESIKFMNFLGIAVTSMILLVTVMSVVWYSRKRA